MSMHSIENDFLRVTVSGTGAELISVMDKELPFQVRRVFWLHHIAGGKDRGEHALLDSTEIIVAVHGAFVVDLDDLDNFVHKAD